MVAANQADFLGQGTASQGTAPGQAPDPAAKAVWERANRAVQPRNLIHTTNPAIGTPEQRLSAHLNNNIGGVAGAFNFRPDQVGQPNAAHAAQANPSNANAIAAQMGIPGTGNNPSAGGGGSSLSDQINAARATGSGFLGLANNVMGNTAGQATSLFNQAQGYGVKAPQITTGQSYQTPPMGGAPMQGAPTQGLTTGPGGMPITGPMTATGLAQLAQSRQDQIRGGGAQAQAQAQPFRPMDPGALLSTVKRPLTNSLASTVQQPPTGFPGVSSMGGAGPSPQPAFQVGQRGAMPSMVNTAQLGNVNTNIAGSLGAAPQVNRDNVSMVDAGEAPGGIYGQLGDMGAQNGSQQNMLGRLEGFLDAPDGPSIAEAQLRQSQANNMAELIGAARSGRGGAGSQAQALRGAMSEGSAIMSDTAGQMATLRAQEADMLKNRQLNAIGLGGQMATAQRGQDLAFRGQDLSALQGDQSTALGARGQDIQAGIANQGTQLGLEQLSGQLSLGARGQDLSALQSDQGAQLGMRGQNLSAAQGNQSTQLGARGQDVASRGQDLGALEGDANRQMAAQDLALRGQMGLTGLGLQAQGQGLQYSQAANALGLGAEGMAQDALNRKADRDNQLAIANQSQDAAIRMQQNEIGSRPGFLEQLGLNLAGSVGNAVGGGIIGSIFSPSQGGGSAAGGTAAAPNYYSVPYSSPASASSAGYSPGSIFNPADPWGTGYRSYANA